MTDFTGELFGNYRLVRQIGHGGFADVYLGTHVYLQTQAAVKVLHIQFANDALESFLSEARTVIQLEHPHIVRVLECSVEKNVPFLVMNYASGGSLRQRYPSGIRLPLEYVSHYIDQVASALQYAHDRKLIHRDIKPENMLIGQNNTLLLSDFGLVLQVQSTNAQTLKEMAGTVPYMAPEQLQGKPQPASDQYALGIVAYEWLSGKRPFQGSFVEVASQHVLSAPPPLSERIPGISPEIERVVFTALAKNPLERFASVQSFARALAQAIAAELDTRAATPLRPFASPSLSSEVESTFLPMRAASDIASVQSPLPKVQPSAYATPVLNQGLRVPHIDEQPTALISTVSQSDVSTSIRSERSNVSSSRNATPAANNLHAFFAQETSVNGLSASTTSTPFLRLQKVLPDTSQHATKRRRIGVALIAGLLVLTLTSLLVLLPQLTPKARQTLGSAAGSSATSTTVATNQGGATNGINGTGGTGNTTTAATSTRQPANQPTPQPSSTPSTQKATLSVTAVTASVNPGSYQGTCSPPVSLTFTGTIQVAPGSPGGTVSYLWLRSDNTESSTATVTFDPGDTVKTVTTAWQGPTSPGSATVWETLEITSPTTVTSQQADAQFVCEAPTPTPVPPTPTPRPTPHPNPTVCVFPPCLSPP